MRSEENHPFETTFFAGSSILVSRSSIQEFSAASILLIPLVSKSISITRPLYISFLYMSFPC
jgi:hypothetical protein